MWEAAHMPKSKAILADKVKLDLLVSITNHAKNLCKDVAAVIKGQIDLVSKSRLSFCNSFQL